ADHTGITVSNLERSLAFWRDVLGFQVSHTAHQTGEMAEQITGVKGAELKLAVVKAPGGHKIELLEYLAPPDRKRADVRPCDVGHIHVALVVDDLDVVIERIVAAGWQADRLWFSEWGAHEIVTVDLDGKRDVPVRTPFGLPFCIDWLHDGRLLIVSGREGLLLRREPDGSLAKHADLGGISDGVWNEIVVDGRGNAYINGGPGIIALVPHDGLARCVADGIAFPNGMAVTPDNATLIIAESHGKKLTAFDIASDGSLSKRRIWADLAGGVPDGICIDADNAVWYADVPNKCCVRVREDGEVLQTICLDRGCFACMLG